MNVQKTACTTCTTCAPRMVVHGVKGLDLHHHNSGGYFITPLWRCKPLAVQKVLPAAPFDDLSGGSCADSESEAKRLVQLAHVAGVGACNFSHGCDFGVGDQLAGGVTPRLYLARRAAVFADRAFEVMAVVGVAPRGVAARVVTGRGLEGPRGAAPLGASRAPNIQEGFGPVQPGVGLYTQEGELVAFDGRLHVVLQ